MVEIPKDLKRKPLKKGQVLQDRSQKVAVLFGESCIFGAGGKKND